MGISDMISDFIHAALRDAEVLELQRNELAQKFGCVPSQVNYVISTRFSPENGYIVESRRGGGGYIRIRRVSVSKQTLLMHAVNSIGEAIEQASATALLNNLMAAEAVSEKEARLMAAAISEQALREVPQEKKPAVRAEILKRMLVICSY